MILNHLSLSVNNVTDTLNFFVKFFDFECIEEKGSGAVAILTNQTRFVLVLTHHKDNNTYPKDFHVGFLQESDAGVFAIYNRLLEGGVKLDGEPKPIRGRLGFYFYAPGDILLEVSRQ